MNKIITYTCPYCGYQSNEDHEVCPACGNGESVSYNNEQKGFDQEYLQSCIDKASKSWKGVDVDKFMDEVRGREPVCEELEKELDEFLKDHVFGKLINRNAGLALARHFAEWQSKQDKETIELAEDHAMLAGMMKMKEQMLKDAVPFYEILKAVPPGPERDKVRVIVLKED